MRSGEGSGEAGCVFSAKLDTHTRVYASVYYRKEAWGKEETLGQKQKTLIPFSYHHFTFSYT